MPRTLFLFAPGAGAPSTSAWMTAWAERIATLGDVVRVDYPYMLAGRRSPDPLPKLIDAHREALARARAGVTERPERVVLIGKSMGGRVGCHLSLEVEVSGLVCLGYPLKGAGKRASIRDEVLRALRVPILFVQGTRDPLCPLDLLEPVRAAMRAKNYLHVVPGGDHSLEVTQRDLRAAGQARSDVDHGILTRISAFNAELPAGI